MCKEEGIPRLRRVRDKIASDAGSPMPPVRVEPWGWESPGREGMVYGKACPIILGPDYFQWGVVLPVSTVFVVRDDDLLRRILCHEFAHCFWEVTRMIREAKDSEWVSLDEDADLSPTERLAKQLVEDHTELVDPADWFGEWDVRHFIAEYGCPDLDSPSQLFRETWVNANYPTRKVVLEFEAQGELVILGEIRIRALEVIEKGRNPDGRSSR